MTKYGRDLLNDPYSLFEKRTESIKLRILNLQEDHGRVEHFISKAVIEEEIENLVDDLIERTLVLQNQSKDRNLNSDE